MPGGYGRSNVLGINKRRCLIDELSGEHVRLCTQRHRVTIEASFPSKSLFFQSVVETIISVIKSIKYDFSSCWPYNDFQRVFGS